MRPPAGSAGRLAGSDHRLDRPRHGRRPREVPGGGLQRLPPKPMTAERLQEHRVKDLGRCAWRLARSRSAGTRGRVPAARGRGVSTACSAPNRRVLLPLSWKTALYCLPGTNQNRVSHTCSAGPAPLGDRPRPCAAEMAWSLSQTSRPAIRVLVCEVPDGQETGGGPGACVRAAGSAS